MVTPESMMSSIRSTSLPAMSVLMSERIFTGFPPSLREAELVEWMQVSEYESVDQLRGSVAQHAVRDPGAYERAQYQRVLSSWRQ